MAIVDRKSQAVTNETATPMVHNNPSRGEGNLKEKLALITPAADDTANSIGRFYRIPSNARLSSMKITAADATTGGTIDIGLYDIDGGAVVDVDFFQDAFDLTGGAFVESELVGNGTAGTPIAIANREKMIWEMLGLTSDPGKEYDVAYTITVTFNGGPTSIVLKTQYVW